MAGKRKRRKARAVRASSIEPAAPPESSSVAAVLPSPGVNDRGAAGDESGAGAAPPLPPDDEPAAGAGEGEGESANDRPGARSSGADSEREMQQRIAILEMCFRGVFLAIPPRNGGGPLSDDEAGMLAVAWEVPLRPYWGVLMGPWTGAILTTFAVVGPRVARERAGDAGGAVG